MRSPSWLPYVVVLLAVALVLAPGGLGVVGHPTGDAPDHFWGTWWVDSHLFRGDWPLVTDVSHHPDALPLWHIDPIGALLAWPLQVLGPVLAFDGMLAVQLLLAGGLLAFAARRLGPGAGFAGAALVTHPYVLGALHSGLTELVGLAPVVLLCWLLAERRPDRRRAALTGLALTLCALQTPYYAVFGALLVGVAVLGEGWRTRLRALPLTAVVAMLTTLPWLLPLRRTLDGGAVSEQNAPGWGGFMPAVDVLTLFTPGPYYFPDTVHNGNPGILQVSYLGWTLLALAALALWRTPSLRTWRWPALALGVLLLGPRLTIAGMVTPVPLPLALLYFPGSPLADIHHPYRLVAVALPGLAVAAAIGWNRLSPRLKGLTAAVALAEALWASPAVWPLARFDPAPPAVDVPDGPRLDWPADASVANRRYLGWQVTHGQPIPYGVNVFLPEDLRRDPLVAALLRTLDDPERRAVNRDVPFRGRVLLPPGETDVLAAQGYTAIVVHRSLLSEREAKRAEALLTDRLGPPAVESGPTQVWTLPEP